MIKLERIYFDEIEKLTIDANKLEYLGKGTLKDNGWGGLKLNISGIKITQEKNIDHGVNKTDSFLKDAEKLLKENKMYVVNADFKNNFFFGLRINGKFYQEIN